MGRPQIPLGGHGVIRTKDEGNRVLAYTRRRFSDGEVRKVSKYGKNKGQALRLLGEKLEELSLDDRVAPRGASTTVGDLVELWNENLKKELEDPDGRAEGTIKQYLDECRLRVVPLLGSFPVRALTAHDILQVTNQVSKGRRKLFKTCLSQSLDIAVSQGLLSVNPMTQLPKEKRRRKRAEIRVPNDSMVARCLSDSEEWATRKHSGKQFPEFGAAVAVFAGTGLRPGELLALRWKDVDLYSTPATVRVAGNIPRTGELRRVPRPKTEGSFRLLVLPAFSSEALLRIRPASPRPEDPIFPSSAGGWRYPSNFGRTWRTFRRDMGYPEWFVPTSLRKSVATKVYNEISPEAARAQLGHSHNSPVTVNHYVVVEQIGPNTESILGRLDGAGKRSA